MQFLPSRPPQQCDRSGICTTGHKVRNLRKFYPSLRCFDRLELKSENSVRKILLGDCSHPPIEIVGDLLLEGSVQDFVRKLKPNKQTRQNREGLAVLEFQERDTTRIIWCWEVKRGNHRVGSTFFPVSEFRLRAFTTLFFSQTFVQPFDCHSFHIGKNAAHVHSAWE